MDNLPNFALKGKKISLKFDIVIDYYG